MECNEEEQQAHLRFVALCEQTASAFPKPIPVPTTCSSSVEIQKEGRRKVDDILGQIPIATVVSISIISSFYNLCFPIHRLICVPSLPP